MTLQPVYSHQALVNIWPALAIGVARVADHSLEDTTIELVFNELMAARPPYGLMLWVGHHDGRYAGFCTTRLHEPFTGPKYLVINHLYVKQGAGKDTILAGLETIREFARKFGCSYIAAYTTRKGFERALKPIGFSPAYMEVRHYLKEERDG